jgi:hypothetical protein
VTGVWDWGGVLEVQETVSVEMCAGRCPVMAHKQSGWEQPSMCPCQHVQSSCP